MGRDIETRLRRLERTNRALLIGLVLAIGAAVAMGAARQKAPKIVTAQQFGVLDDMGRTRAILGMSGEGDKANPNFQMIGRNTKTVLSINVLSDESAAIKLFGPRKASILINMGEMGDPFISIDNQDGAEVFTKP